MLTVYDCIVNAHDLRLVILAAAICTLASFTAVNLLHHVRSSKGRMRQVWLGVAATATGFGIWATHFIAMLAFSPGIPSAYNIALTFLSLVPLLWLARRFPHGWVWPAAAGAAALVFLLGFLAPVVLEPVFNRFRPQAIFHARMLKLGIRSFMLSAKSTTRATHAARSSREKRMLTAIRALFPNET